MHTLATFSICALDPATGEAGVAVASACLAVGSLVPAAAPGAGAIASQAFVNTTFGPRGLDRLRHGVPAAEVVRRLTEHDITITSDSTQNMKFYERERLAEKYENG